jgi:putative membrane protein
MKNKILKVIALSLCAALLVCGIGASAYAINYDNKYNTSDDSLGTESGIEKNETVYILTGAEGSIQKIIVSDWIKNSDNSDTISDTSELTDIEVTKGETTYTMNGDNMRVWDAKGGDVYYKGEIDKELPVGISVSYKLDGNSITPDELAGKSGKVTIRFDYENYQYETVEIDSQQEKIYVPFVMLTGMLLDNDVFTNVDVTNGKIINDGDRTAVIGIALPGLQSNLKIDSEDFEIPDYVEITADVENFELSNTVTIATNEVFNEIDTENLNSLQDITDSVDELTSAMDQLMDGSSALYDGLSTLLEKSDELIAGIDKLADGALALKNGAAAVDDGAASLSDGTKALAGGLDQLDSNSAQLRAGSKQVFESLLSMADTQLAAAGVEVPKLTIDNYADVLNGLISSLDPDNIAEQANAAARQKVSEAVNAQRDAVTTAVTEKVQEEVTSQVTAAVRENVESQVLEALGLTKDTYDAAVSGGMIDEAQQAQIAATIDAQMASEQVKALISSNTAAQMESDAVKETISQKTDEQIELLIEQNMNSAEVQEQITAALEQASSGAATISQLKTQLDSYNTFYSGLNQYTAGVASAKDGADKLNSGAATLKAGTAELAAGASELYDGILTLKDGMPALVDGITQLKDGAMKLSDGLKEFNEEGVQKIVDVLDGDVSGLLTRIQATVDVSNDYKSFSGISDDMDGTVKFIYRTDSIEAN